MGWRVDAVASGISQIPECVREYDQVFDMDWTRDPLDIKWLPASARRIRSIVKSGEYDIVHVHTPIAAFVTRFALRRLRRRGKPKVIYTAHGFHFHPLGKPLLNAVYRTLERTAGRWTDCLIVINEYDRHIVEKHQFVPRNKIVHLQGIGIDREAFSPSRVGQEKIAKVRGELGIAAGKPLYLMVAEFIPRKRHVDAIEAFRGLNGDARLAFAGVGKLFGRTKKFVKELGLGGRVHFLGLREDVPALIRSSVATVFPSVREGLSRSVMESLCLEVPVIGTDIRGVRDLLEGGGGLLVPPRSPDALRKAMEWVLDHPREAEAMGKKGRETTEEYDIDRLLRLHETLYAGLLSQ